MLVKIVNGNRDRTIQGTHVSITKAVDGSGIAFELSPGSHRFSIPEDGQTVYIMNDQGDTVDSYRLTPRKAEGGTDEAIQAQG